MANFNFNKVMLGGRLTADPENRQTETGISMTRFSIAVNRRQSKDSNQPQADFFNVVAWRATADFVSRFFKKGSSIFVVGTIQNRSWTDNDGNKRYATDIVADEVNFVDAKGETPAGGQYTPDSYEPSFSTPSADAPKFEEIKGDDDLPF
ncbi:MAG: single-stranded DNA-binding protein [Clostridia bacterium]|nr:single-stranded DNA-binding protein [Clostridia bacterium]